MSGQELVRCVDNGSPKSRTRLNAPLSSPSVPPTVPQGHTPHYLTSSALCSSPAASATRPCPTLTDPILS